MTDARDAVHQFLLDFVEDRDRSRATAARMEPMVCELTAADARYEDLEYALAVYDGRAGKSAEPGLLNQDGFAAQCKQTLRDLDDHRYCQHSG